MKAIWDSEAKKAQRQVVAYIRKEFGVKRAKKFRQEVDETVNQLMRSPGIGHFRPCTNLSQRHHQRPKQTGLFH